MGVYIKGMDMPKDGCHHTICIYADGTVSTGGRAYMAIPVPPHGDLVDKQYAYQNTMAMGEHTRKIILKQIDALPIIIPEEPPKEEALSGK